MTPPERSRASSHSFTCHTAAAPDRIWDALTTAEQTSAYLHNLEAHSSWQPDDPVAVTYNGSMRLTGHVLCALPGERLSYVLQATPTDPSLYLTWLIRPNPTGTTITLIIDEPEAPDTTHDAEDTWLPVLAALQEHLADG